MNKMKSIPIHSALVLDIQSAHSTSIVCMHERYSQNQIEFHTKVVCLVSSVSVFIL